MYLCNKSYQSKICYPQKPPPPPTPHPTPLESHYHLFMTCFLPNPWVGSLISLVRGNTFGLILAMSLIMYISVRVPLFYCISWQLYWCILHRLANVMTSVYFFVLQNNIVKLLENCNRWNSFRKAAIKVNIRLIIASLTATLSVGKLKPKTRMLLKQWK